MSDPIAWLFEVTTGSDPPPPWEWEPPAPRCPSGWCGCRHYGGWHVFGDHRDSHPDDRHYGTRLGRQEAARACGREFDCTRLELVGPSLAAVRSMVEAAELRRLRP